MKLVSECPFLFLNAINHDNPTSTITVAKKEWFSEMSIGDCYAAYGQSIDIDECGEYNVTAYNFHNGSNWESVILESPCDEEIDYEVITDEKLILQYWEAIENKSYDKEEKGFQYYEYDNFEIVKSNWQSSWSAFEINEK